VFDSCLTVCFLGSSCCLAAVFGSVWGAFSALSMLLKVTFNVAKRDFGT